VVSTDAVPFHGGTSGSNPLRSSKESVVNLMPTTSLQPAELAISPQVRRSCPAASSIRAAFCASLPL